MFFLDFKSLSHDERWQEINDVDGSKCHQDVDSITTLDSEYKSEDEYIPFYKIMQLEFVRWRNLPVSHVESWRKRAEILNSRPFDGRFLHVPPDLGHDDFCSVM